MTHSFDGWPNVVIVQFRQAKPVGEHFLKRFDSGRALFPRDPLADVAAEITQCGEIPGILVEGALKSFADDPNGIRAEHVSMVRQALHDLTKPTAYRRLLSDTQVVSLTDDFEWRKKMLPDIKVNWRLVRAEPAE